MVENNANVWQWFEYRDGTNTSVMKNFKVRGINDNVEECFYRCRNLPFKFVHMIFFIKASRLRKSIILFG